MFYNLSSVPIGMNGLHLRHAVLVVEEVYEVKPGSVLDQVLQVAKVVIAMWNLVILM